MAEARDSGVFGSARNKVARQLNERPRETLQFETPAEEIPVERGSLITNSASTTRGGSYLPALRSKSLPRLTDQGLQKINDLARHYGVSADAVMTLLQALLNSKGTDGGV